MATFETRGDSIRVGVCVNNVRKSKSFPKAEKRAAKTWALEQEGSLSGKALAASLFGDVLTRYELEEAPKAKAHRGPEWVVNKIKTFRTFKVDGRRLADMQVRDIDGGVLHSLFKQRRDRTMKNGKPVSVATFNREWNQLRAVFAKCADHGPDGWKLLHVNPCKGIKKPKNPPGRARGITEKEIKDVCEYGLSYKRGAPATIQHRVALMFLFCIETAMRGGEAMELQRKHIHPNGLQLHIPKSKNGDARDVPLSKRAREILKLIPGQVGLVFDVDHEQKDSLFRKAVKKCEIENLHFHDSRGEAITRMSRKLSILDLARAIGHRDINSLMIYYNASAAELAARLG